jgi:signal transduction histidine kinase
VDAAESVRRRHVAWGPLTALLAAGALLALLVLNLLTLAGISANRRNGNRPVSAAASRVRGALLDAEWIDISAAIGVMGLLGLLFAIHRDVSRREELEEALRESMRFQEQFVAILGHDLRNPLGAIAMGAAVLQGEGATDKHAAIARRISNSVARMTRLTDQLLDLTRARMTGGIPVAPRPETNLAETVSSVVDELRIAHPGVELDITGEPAVRGAWDPDRIAQLVSNLVGNAIEHGGGAPVCVHVESGRENAILCVHNGGPPIPSELLPHIFDPFRRGARDGHGLGLGLYIADQIVRAHGGAIDVRSAAEGGTTFRVTLPAGSR